MDKVFQLEKEQLERNAKHYPAFAPGDMISVYYKIREKDKERIHPLQGIVLKLQGAMHRKTFTLRRIAFGEAYEVTFPYYSPNIEKIEMVKESRRRARRARLYYLRGRLGKKAMLT